MGNTNDVQTPLEKRKLNLNSFRELGLLAFIFVLSVIIQFLNKEFLTAEFINDMVKNTAILGILAIGMMVVLLTGGIDLSIGSNMALTGMVAALLVQHNPGIHPVISILLAMAIGLICGVVIGLLVSQLNVIPIIASLGMNYVYRGLTFLLSKGAWVSAYQLPDSFKAVGTGTFLGISYLVWVALVVFLIAAYFLRSTRTGRMIYAVGSNKEAVSVSGINARQIELLVYSIMGVLSGLAGALWVAKYASAQPDTATGYEVNVIAACVMGGVSVTGGRGKVIGVFLGALLIGIINNALPLLNQYISSFWQSFIQGMIILIAIIMNVLVKRRRDRADLLRREI